MGGASGVSQPNIVLIVMNDTLPSDLDAISKTRALLGDAGTTFPNLFASTPLCSPSRASLLTGQFAHNYGVVGNQGATGGLRRYKAAGIGNRTIQVPLRAAGYRTGLLGKLLNGVPGSGLIAPDWDRAFVQTDFRYFGFEVNDNGRRRFGDKAYSTTVLRQQAAAFIRSTPVEQPRFLHVSPIASHNAPTSPASVSARFWDAYQTPSPDPNETDVSDKPEFLRHRTRLTDKSMRFLNAHHRERLRTLLPVDDLVAGVVDALADTGRLENSHLFFLSDNGALLGHHRHVGKTIPDDRGARTPLLARGPGFLSGTIDERLGLNVDVTATIAAVTGVDIPDLDGVSLLAPPARTDVLLEWLGEPEAQHGVFYSPSGPNYAALRPTEQLYVEDASGERELYDYRSDPYELDNLLANWGDYTPSPEAEAAAAPLAARLAALRECAGATCV
jgi:arylsulfatase A-like enzyme